MKKIEIWGCILGLLMCFLILGIPMSVIGGEGDSGKKSMESQELKKIRDPERDSVETYKDLTKLLITLATGTLVLIPTLFGLFKSVRIKAWCRLYASLISLVISVFCGLLVLSSLAGSQHVNDYNIDLLGTRIFAIPQWICFSLGLSLFISFALSTLRSQGSDTDRFGRLLDLLVAKEVISDDEKASYLK